MFCIESVLEFQMVPHQFTPGTDISFSGENALDGVQFCNYVELAQRKEQGWERLCGNWPAGGPSEGQLHNMELH